MIQRVSIFLFISIFLSACTGESVQVTPTAMPAATAAPTLPAESESVPTLQVEPTNLPPTLEPTTAPVGENSPLPTEAPVASSTPLPAATPTPAPPVVGDPSTVTMSLRPWLSGFTLPVGIVHAGDGSGRLFVVEKTGRIRIVQDQQILPEPLIDLSGRVSNGSEQGLLGLAFEPGRAERFYVNFTNLNGDTEIYRYRTLPDNPNRADPDSGERLLLIEQPAGNHNGGNLVFGPDSYLWIGMGDGGAADDRFGTAQNYNSILGAMLRLDVSAESGFDAAPDNPFAGGDDGAPTIWAKGLRNPWRYSFDRLTDELWIADVGQNQWEEVNRVSSREPALNFGWPQMEASHCYLASDCSGLNVVMPVTEYDHNFGCSITGGYVYRGQQFPKLQGIYIFGDYCSGNYWGIPADAQSLTQPTPLLQSPFRPLVIGEDEAGELFVGSTDGTIYQIVGE